MACRIVFAAAKNTEQATRTAKSPQIAGFFVAANFQRLAVLAAIAADKKPPIQVAPTGFAT